MKKQRYIPPIAEPVLVEEEGVMNVSGYGPDQPAEGEQWAKQSQWDDFDFEEDIDEDYTVDQYGYKTYKTR